MTAIGLILILDAVKKNSDTKIIHLDCPSAFKIVMIQKYAVQILA